MSNKQLILESLDSNAVFTYSLQTKLERSRLDNIPLKKEYIPTAGDKIFIYPDADIPKFKVKPFCDKYKVSLIRDKNKASQKFVGTSYLESFYKNNDKRYYSVTIARFKEWFAGVIYETDPKYKDFINVLEKYTGERVYYPWSVTMQLEENYSKPNPFGIALTDKKYKGSYDFVCFIKDDEEDILQKLESSESTYTSLALLKHMNQSTVMDERMYFSIKNLLESPDKSNFTIAIETMANCDYERSSVWLLLLIYNFKSEIRDCKASKHVNFTSLLTFFDMNPSNYITIEHLINSLKKRNLLTQGRLKILMDIAEKEFKEDKDTEYFEVIGFKPAQQIIQDIDEGPEEIVLILDDNEEELSLGEVECL